MDGWAVSIEVGVTGNPTKAGPMDGWEGVLFLAATYAYFLIFAQFGFLSRLSELGIGQSELKPILAAMALGGIAMSLLVPRTPFWTCPKCRLQTGFLGCAWAAGLSLLPLGRVTAIGVSLVIGLSLGVLTVTLVSHLPKWIGDRNPLVKIGLGTGLGYFLCNVPALFNARPATIAIVAGLLCLAATVVANRSPMKPEREALIPLPGQSASLPFILTLAWFTALVWLDSAAFYIIQHSPELKSGTWSGDGNLWRTGALHLSAALAAGLLLTRRRTATTLGLAFAILGAACLLLRDPDQIHLAALLYPVGVSLYSVALVAYPAFLMVSAGFDQRARRAGILYAVAGWIGSAMGIGMAQNLHHVPAAFVGVAAILFAAPLLWRLSESGRRQALAVLAVCAVAWVAQQALQPNPPQPAQTQAQTTAQTAGQTTTQTTTQTTAQTTAQRGRQVYIAEGCIHCHSQYVRPASPDVAMWGPVRPLADVKAEEPPLIGNRRQGPDLSQVGGRRSPLWLRLHLIDPRAVSSRSIMPGYAYLFREPAPQIGHDTAQSTRGDDLVAYLASLSSPGAAAHYAAVTRAWSPSPEDLNLARQLDGEQLFTKHCATCHIADGQARTMASFKRLPPNLFRDAFFRIAPGLSEIQEQLAIGRVIKYGLPGTDMPGLEYLPDAQVAAMAEWVETQRTRELAGSSTPAKPAASQTDSQ